MSFFVFDGLAPSLRRSALHARESEFRSLTQRSNAHVQLPDGDIFERQRLTIDNARYCCEALLNLSKYDCLNLLPLASLGNANVLILMQAMLPVPQ